MWAPGTVFGGRYTLAEQLVDGGAAEVWWANDVLLDRWAVVKVLHPVLGSKAQAASQFRSEAGLVADWAPPWIGDTRHEGQTGHAPQTPYVVVQFVDGSPLSPKGAAGPVPHEHIPDTVARLLEALHAAQRHAIGHCGSRPSEPNARKHNAASRPPVRRSPRQRTRRAAVAALPAAAAVAAVFVMHSAAGTDIRPGNGSPAIAQAPVVPVHPAPEATPSAVTEASAQPSTSSQPTTAEVPPPPPPSTPVVPNAPVPTGISSPPPGPVRTGHPSAATKPRTATTAGTPTRGSSGPPSATKPATAPRTLPPPPAPAAAAPPPAPVVPAGCGGAGWGAVTNVGNGLRIGIDTAGPGAGSRVVTGGHTEYGWTATQAGPWHNIRSCNTGGPTMAPTSYMGGPVTLGDTTMFGTGLLTITPAPTPGAVLITGFAGQQCLTDNGPGRQLTFTYCSPGNTAQQWYTPWV